uniref:KIAA1755 n=1 Tax=Chinchilla lanigera TaxID=34839 RepID=A0A8C2VZU6_CHILA
MDPPSLDAAIQHVLAGLYPPFEATAPIVLSQVFRLLDSDFQGDGLSFLLDFLIPAKRLCEQVREAACAPYAHRLFLHEGWPLCLRDEVVVHLAPLNPLLLRQGDFYLQVEPGEEQSVSMMIKCLSLDLRTVDKKPVPESSHPLLFTQEWLEAINSDLGGSPLHNCLVASENGIAPVPWAKITSPEFVDGRPQAKTVPSPAWDSLPLEALDLRSPQELHLASSPGSQVLLAQNSVKDSASPVGPASETKVEKTKKGDRRLPKPKAHAGQNTSTSSFSGSPTAGLKPSFLKVQRRFPVPQDKASLQHDQPWRALSSQYSSKPHQAKPLEKDGTTQTKTSGPVADSSLLSGKKAGFPEAAAGPPERAPGLEEEPPGPEPKIETVGAEVFHSRIACLPGGRDRAGRPLLLVSTAEEAWKAPWCTALEVTKLLSYLCSIPRPEDTAKGLVVVIDARKQPPQSALVSALQATQAVAPASFSALLILGEKEDAVPLQVSLDIQVEVLASLKALSHHVDPSQLPAALNGSFPYCHSEWVQFFQKLDPFLAELHRASSLLQASIEEFEKGDPPGGVQEATSCLSKSKELMEAVLRDPGLLHLQQEGGATLARLQCEASRLDSSPDIRSHLAEAAALYSLVDEQLHVLVTASNHLLGRLELRIRLGRLEAAICQVSDWMEQEGSQCLQALTPEDRSMETVARAHAEFEAFFLQAVAQYRRGLELSKQAAQLGVAAGGADKAGGQGLPELVAFAATQRAFQAKLTHFYMAAERQRTDLDTLLHLHRFCKKMTWFHMDCQDLVSQLRLGKAKRASPGDQRRLHRYLQRLASEFPAEKLAAMALQVASLSQAGLGQDLWQEARGRHQEIQSLLKKALAHCPCPVDSTAHSAPSEPRGAAAKGWGPNGEAASKGRWDLPLQDSLGVDHLPKPCWPPWAARSRQSRTLQVDPPCPGQVVGADDGKGSQKLPEPTLERSCATLFSWQWLPRKSQVSCPTGDSFSSEGTDSQTSLEDSPQTSPPASL